MASIQPTTAMLPVAAATTDGAAASEDSYPAGKVDIPRTGLKTTLGVLGGVSGIGGALLAGVPLMRGGAEGALLSRVRSFPLAAGAGLVGLGAAFAIGAALTGPRTEQAVRTGIPSESIARELAADHDKPVDIVRDANGTYALVERPTHSSGGSGGSGRSRGGYHPAPRYDPDPAYPRTDPYYPDPGYGGSTSPGDENGSGGYDPPSYDPPSYDPPSYDPPSYDPPSYDPPSSDYGDSTSNGNPSYDDF